MALKFKIDIPGNHGAIVRGSPEFRARRVNFWKVKGVGEIVNLNGGRMLTVRCILFDEWDEVDDLLEFLGKLDDLVNHNDTLEETGNIQQEFENVTFEGYEMLPLEGQQEPGPLQDIAGTVDDGWFIQIVLHFYQLFVPKV